MALDKICDITFPGLEDFATGNTTVTVSHGTRPSAFTFEVADVYGMVPRIGRVSITENGREIVGFRDCAINDVFRAGGDVRTFTVQVLDRRWVWWRGRDVISGRYNVRRPDKTIIEETQKSPQDLAKLCLQALGESGFDISRLPNKVDKDSAPEIEWDSIPPAQALDELVNLLACRVVLTSADRIAICPNGKGLSLPDVRTKNDQNSIQSVAIPDSLKFIAGHTRWQGLLKLRPVGLELPSISKKISKSKTGDGSRIRPVDDLSFAPSGGWKSSSPLYPDREVTYGKDTEERELAQQLAAQCVWRWFQVEGQVIGKTIKLGPVPGCDFEVKYLWQYRISDSILDTAEGENGARTQLAAYVVGQWYDSDLGSSDDSTVVAGNTKPNLRFPESVTIDSENNIVVFPRPMYMVDSSGNYAYPDLYLYCAYTLADAKTRIPDRFTYKKSLPVRPVGTGAMPVKVDDVFRKVVITHQYKQGAGYLLKSTTPNDDEMTKAANYYLGAKAQELNFASGTDREYEGFLDISPDGAIQQVTWGLNDGEGFTRASRNTEHSIYVPRYAQRQLTAQVATINMQLEEIKKIRRGEL